MLFAFALFLATAGIPGIPLVELPATAGGGDTFAVILTGDGGWKRVDAQIAERLRAEGIPVVGFISSTYFRTRRTPEESAAALERVIRAYQKKWQKPRVILIGFSRGADSLPFMASRLPADLRGATRLIALLGAEPWIDFKYNPSWTLAHYFHHEPQVAVLPEVEKLRGQKVLCVYGSSEKDSLCPRLDRGAFTVVVEPGGHHFGGRYHEVADVILENAGVTSPARSR